MRWRAAAELPRCLPSSGARCAVWSGLCLLGAVLQDAEVPAMRAHSDCGVTQIHSTPGGHASAVRCSAHQFAGMGVAAGSACAALPRYSLPPERAPESKQIWMAPAQNWGDWPARDPDTVASRRSIDRPPTHQDGDRAGW